jgi:hypothetical protein
MPPKSLVRKMVRDHRGSFDQVPYTKTMISHLQKEDPIMFGLAKGPWALEWANRQEAKGKRLGGVDVYEAAPLPPFEAVTWAEDVASQLVRLNGMSLLDLYQRAIECGLNKSTEQFGALLGCQIAGHGISWTDDLPSGCDHLIQRPHREFYV